MVSFDEEKRVIWFAMTAVLPKGIKHSTPYALV
jgi:hypothetical protein